MIDTQKLIEQFQKLSLEDKRWKLINFITTAKLSKLDDIFKELTTTIQTSHYADNDFLTGIYSDIIWYAHQIQTIQKENEANTLAKVSSKIKHIHKLESDQKEDTNKLLSQI